MILSSSLLFNARLVLWSGYSVKVKFTRKRLSHTEVQVRKGTKPRVCLFRFLAHFAFVARKEFFMAEHLAILQFKS